MQTSLPPKKIEDLRAWAKSPEHDNKKIAAATALSKRLKRANDALQRTNDDDAAAGDGWNCQGNPDLEHSDNKRRSTAGSFAAGFEATGEAERIEAQTKANTAMKELELRERELKIKERQAENQFKLQAHASRVAACLSSVSVALFTINTSVFLMDMVVGTTDCCPRVRLELAYGQSTAGVGCGMSATVDPTPNA